MTALFWTLQAFQVRILYEILMYINTIHIDILIYISIVTCPVFGPVTIEELQRIIKPVLLYICDCFVRSPVSICLTV